MPGSVPAHREWAATILSVWVQAYNTNLVKKADLPKTYEDLLDPKWKGKLGIEAKNDDWFATVVQQHGRRAEGPRVLPRAGRRRTASRRAKGHTLLNNMVVSGEVPLALTVYNYMPRAGEEARARPIDWFVIEPAIARSNAVGVARQAPHPTAALLFYEYLLGPEGQKAMVSIDYVPTNTKVESPLKGVKIVQTDPVRSLDESREVEQALRRASSLEGSRTSMNADRRRTRNSRADAPRRSARCGSSRSATALTHWYPSTFYLLLPIIGKRARPHRTARSASS